MARVRLSSIVSSIDGSIGGATFQSGLFGNVIRQRPNSKKTSTAYQQRIHNVMRSVQTAWMAMSNEQRRQWEQYIAFVNSTIKRDKNILASGYSFFCRYNFCRVFVGAPYSPVIVYSSNPNWPSFLSLKNESNVLNCYVSVDFVTESVLPMLALSYRQSLSSIFLRKSTRLMSIDGIVNLSFSVTASYLEQFGVLPQVGESVSYSLYWFHSSKPLISAVQSGTVIIS